MCRLNGVWSPVGQIAYTAAPSAIDAGRMKAWISLRIGSPLLCRPHHQPTPRLSLSAKTAMDSSTEANLSVRLPNPPPVDRWRFEAPGKEAGVGGSLAGRLAIPYPPWRVYEDRPDT